MIGRLKGTLIDKQPPWLWVDVAGVGYEIEAPMSTIFQLPAVGQGVTLYTHLSVREDAHLLFGFHSPAEKALFRELIRVSGVGPKLALAILSGIGVEAFWDCARNGDSSQLTKIPGDGKKTAERLVVEMRDRAGADSASVTGNGGGSRSALQEARSALEALGYKPAEVQRLTRDADEQQDPEKIIREALRRAVKS